MGESRRRKLAGNTEPDKQWHQDKAARKHARKALSRMKSEFRRTGISSVMALAQK